MNLVRFTMTIINQCRQTKTPASKIKSPENASPGLFTLFYFSITHHR